MIKKIIMPVIGVIALVLLMMVQGGAFATNLITPGMQESKEDLSGTSITITKTEQPEYYHSVGSVRSRDEIDVIPRIVARILEMNVRSGDHVKRGDILAVLDGKDLAAMVSQGREQFRAVTASINAADEQIKAANAALDFAKKEYERSKSLYEQKAISKQSFDSATTALRQAEAGRQQAVQQKRAAEAQASAASESIKQAEAGYEYATLLSPIDGIVAERLADPGDLGNPSNPILRIFNPLTMQLEVPIREALVKEVTLNTTVLYDVPALGKSYEGTVMEIVPYVDPHTRTFLAKICINDNTDLMPGMFGTVRIPLKSSKEVILIPEQSVIRTGQLESVTEKKDNLMLRRQIKTVKSEKAGMLEVISGLAVGQTIVAGSAK